MLDETLDIELLDLLDPMRAPLLRSVLMETLSDRFMRQIAFGLFQRMRNAVSLLSCIQNVITHESAISALPEVMLAGISELTPLHGRMMLAIDGDLIGAMVDAMCGATKAHPFERYELSALETRIGKQIIDFAYSIVTETFAPLAPLELQAIAYENATGMLAIADGQEWMIAITGIFETPLGSGTIRIITPYAAFESLETKINSQSGLLGGRGPDINWTNGVEVLSDSTPINLSFEIARANMPMLAFTNLTPGDILPITLLPHAVAIAGDVDLFMADFGQNDGYVCCRVNTSPLEGDENMSDTFERITGTERLVEPERVELERLQAQPRGGPAITAKAVLDRVQVAVAVELGRTQITVKELRTLRHGQILHLDQTIGEPLAIYANGQKLAYGEVVAVANDRYGVRVTALSEDAAPADEDTPL